MKTIRIPANINVPTPTAENPQATTPATFESFILDGILTHASFGEGAKAVFTAEKIAASLVAAAERAGAAGIAANSAWEVEDAHYDMLKNAVETMTFSPVAARRVAPFLRAVIEAT